MEKPGELTGDALQNLKMRKRQARSRAAALIAGLPPEARGEMDAAIAESLATLQETVEARSICVFLSMPDEVDTHGIVKKLVAMGKTVWAPRVDTAEHCLLWGRVTDFQRDLAPGIWGILEPAKAVRMPFRTDLVIVPGRAFDRGGGRLGRGGGYYDAFLAGLPATVCRCAVCYSIQLMGKVPAGPGDAPVHLLVTEREIIRTPLPR